MKEVAENFSQSHHKNQCAEYTALVPSHKTVHLFHIMKEENSIIFTLVIPTYITVVSYMDFCSNHTAQAE